jgi:hypothetical protein
MGKLFILLVILVLGGIGYYLWDTIQKAPKEATLPGYVNTLQRDEQKAQAVAGHANVENVQAAISAYKSQKGVAPATLQDLVPDFLDHVPGGLQYDAATGTVSPAQ